MLPLSHLASPWIISNIFTLLLNRKSKFIASLSSSQLSQLAHFHSSSDTNSIVCLLESCKSMEQLKQIHSLTIRNGLASKPIVQSKIIAFSCTQESGDMKYARQLFDTFLEPNVFIWNTMIKGYFRAYCPGTAVSMYVEMLGNNVMPDSYTFPFLLGGLASCVALECGEVIHAHVWKFGFDSNKNVQNALIRMYFCCGQVELARGVFDMSLKSDVVNWSAMISGYNRSRQFEESRKLFDAMEEKGLLPSSLTLVSVLTACSKLRDIGSIKRVHQYISDSKVEPNLILDNALIDAYAACGEMDLALGFFESMKTRDVISWTTIVTGFVNSGQAGLARKYFDQMPERDSISWTAMIDGYLKQNQFKEVLMLFREMQAAKLEPDEFTVVSILTACAHLGALELGGWIKAYIDKKKIKNDVYVGNSLIDMYFKCGNVEKAMGVFNKMLRKDKFTWTAVVVGLAINGHGKEAIEMFGAMQSTFVAPDQVTYIGVLCACTHNGMVHEGRRYFARMTTEHGIEPNVAHYGCMVDLLGRAGHLKEAYELIKNMPMEPNTLVWGALLGACRVHKNVDMAEMAATKLLELEPENGSVYVLLCNIYAACNKLENLRKLRKIMMDRGIRKIPGCSLIEMNGVVHEFVAGDQSHPQLGEIYSKLAKMTKDLKLTGYKPDISEVFLDVGEEDKESALNKHSEKLAIAFGLLSSGPSVTIRIVKNLRICVDCHNVAKLVSKIYSREVIIRDRTRFHHFRLGSCSCKDYW